MESTVPLEERASSAHEPRALRQRATHGSHDAHELGLARLPREKVATEQRQKLIRSKANQADDHNRRVHVVEMSIALLLIEPSTQTRFFTNQLGHDQVGPSPTD